MTARHWHILGAGAMGCLLAARLRAAGRPVTLLLRDPPASANGIVSVESATQRHDFDVHLGAAEQPGAIRHLLVATKAPQIVAALQQVAHRLQEDTQLVLAANGMGYIEAALAASGVNSLYCCTTTEGAYRIGALHIRHAGHGQTLFGHSGGGSPPDWYQDWQATDLQCAWLDPIEPALWHKLAINCAINPLTAEHRCPNGALVEQPALRRQMLELCAEISAVSLAAGYPQTAAQIEADALEVARKTAHNRSSMLQDVLAGRATEIDFITGHLLQVARRRGVATPHNTALYQRIKHLERGAPAAGPAPSGE
ncbi:ketopantoate reductase family protein [Haliea sp. E17]|uniref:ketopantoate reductase family protein n=1 Tax=Haliea sp. E17 TaxID=3401576 RepID=UPI003AAF8188